MLNFPHHRWLGSRGTASNTDDIEEVTNYLRAFRLAQDKLRNPDGLPTSVRLLCDAHRVLLDGARGADTQPGELRRSQNWIGGTRPGTAAFVPPPAERVADLLGHLGRFIHDEAGTLPPLVRIALAHAQFETIHSPLSRRQWPHRTSADCSATRTPAPVDHPQRG